MSPFSDPVIKSLDTDEAEVKSNPKNHVPLLSQEEIDDEQPPRINMTAVICTAIVAVCATIIILIARPWRTDNDEQVAQLNVTEEVVPATTEPQPIQAKPAEPQKQSTVQPADESQKQSTVQPAEQKQQGNAQPPAEQRPANGLPLVPVTKTGTANPYNSVRLIDASSRKLTKAEVAQMNKTELALARNAIYARHGYVYKNAELGEFFSKQSWFKPNKTLKLEDVKPLFSETEVANINLILAQEKK